MHHSVRSKTSVTRADRALQSAVAWHRLRWKVPVIFHSLAGQKYWAIPSNERWKRSIPGTPPAKHLIMGPLAAFPHYREKERQSLDRENIRLLHWTPNPEKPQAHILLFSPNATFTDKHTAASAGNVKTTYKRRRPQRGDFPNNREWYRGTGGEKNKQMAVLSHFSEWFFLCQFFFFPETQSLVLTHCPCLVTMSKMSTFRGIEARGRDGALQRQEAKCHSLSIWNGKEAESQNLPACAFLSSVRAEGESFPDWSGP